MKIAILSLAVLASVAMAAPAAPHADDTFDGNAKCEISAFRPSWSKINDCCLNNMGGSDFDQEKNHLNCRLPINNEGFLRKCVKDLGFAAAVECDY
ncbi:hypothetical protein BGZ91_006256 [Linnemannia elongata]|nr:hypothetical protein BGZ91_006256 [Linnemannia elongata]KAG0079086.1 hypothetical protein BGZ90_003582 [Linnemannia elongata]